MTFYNFLENQIDRDDPVGDLARDAMYDKRFPHIETEGALLSHLRIMGACDGALDAASEAWKEYERSADE